MTAANKAKGSRFETDLENALNEQGLHGRRLPRAGAKDIGDVAITLKSGSVIVIEAKNVKTVAMAEFLRQADVEAGHYDEKYKCSTYGVVAVKARGKGAGDARVTMTLDTLINLLKWEGLS